MTLFIASNVPPPASAGGWFLPVSQGQLLCRDGQDWAPLRQAQLPLLPTHERLFLGYLAGEPCWVAAIPEIPEIPGGQWLGLRSQLGRVEDSLFSLAGRALQLVQWHTDHRFCGRCGCPTQEVPGERAMLCEGCELRYYPRLSPCMITLVTRGNECLLARHSRAKTPIYTALAGFVEAGERVEETVHREVMEEVGLSIADPRYFGSQSWPFPGQLMLGFHAEYLSGDIQIDGDEMLDARWWRYDRLPDVPPASTLSGQLIGAFVERHRHR